VQAPPYRGWRQPCSASPFVLPHLGNGRADWNRGSCNGATRAAGRHNHHRNHNCGGHGCRRHEPGPCVANSLSCAWWTRLWESLLASLERGSAICRSYERGQRLMDT
jgi:hypothetical protein